MLNYIFVIFFVCSFSSCTPSQIETTWELKLLPESDKNQRDKIASKILKKFEYLSYGSSDKKTIRIVGKYVGEESQELTIWIEDAMVIIFESRDINSRGNKDFKKFLASLKKLLQQDGTRVEVRSFAAWGINIR